jgi:hypothetical protein
MSEEAAWYRGVVGAATLAAALAVVGPLHATAPGVQCQAAKLRATGREVRDHLHCWGLGSVGQQSPECFAAAATRRAKVFVRCEARLACLTSGDSDAVGDRVGAHASTQLGALLPSSGLFGSRCTQAKLEAAGLRFHKVAKAHASNTVRPNPSRLATRIVKADARFLAAFLAADGLSNCQRTGDGPYELERNDAWVADFRRRLFPDCGDGIAVGDEECDGGDDAACPRLCTVACGCAQCGNGAREPGEQCDGTDDAFCPGACAPECTCPGPVCGDGVVGGIEECDGSCNVDPSYPPLGCFPPGHAEECRCCATSLCWDQDTGWLASCCPGLDCYIDPTPAPHKQGYCIAS